MSLLSKIGGYHDNYWVNNISNVREIHIINDDALKVIKDVTFNFSFATNASLERDFNINGCLYSHQNFNNQNLENEINHLKRNCMEMLSLVLYLYSFILYDNVLILIKVTNMQLLFLLSLDCEPFPDYKNILTLHLITLSNIKHSNKIDFDKICKATNTTFLRDHLRNLKEDCNLQYKMIFNIIVDIEKYEIDNILEILDKIQLYYELNDIRLRAFKYILKRDKE
ncbi:hypothetical protein COBT_001709, partial [Conglomerata obtusa]